MTVRQEKSGNRLTVYVSGRMDSTTAPELDRVVENELEGTGELVFDFKGLEYTSSAGLRVLLKAQKRMSRQGNMKLINVCDDIKDLLEVTGFSEFLTVE